MLCGPLSKREAWIVKKKTLAWHVGAGKTPPPLFSSLPHSAIYSGDFYAGHSVQLQQPSWRQQLPSWCSHCLVWPPRWIFRYEAEKTGTKYCLSSVVSKFGLFCSYVWVLLFLCFSSAVFLCLLFCCFPKSEFLLLLLFQWKCSVVFLFIFSIFLCLNSVGLLCLSSAAFLCLSSVGFLLLSSVVSMFDFYCW